MKTIINYLFFTITIICFNTACKKESTTTNTNNSGSGEYVEFKIDGQLYRMDENLTASPVIVATATHQGPFSGQYGLQLAFASSAADEETTLIIWDAAPITKPHYTLTLTNIATLVTYIKPDHTQYMISSSSNGNINFTSIDTTLHHTVEGTFEIDQLDLQDTDGNFISSGHTLTEGKFRTSID